MFKNGLFRNLLLALVVVALSCVVCGCTIKSNILSEVKSEGKIVLGTCADYPPYEFHRILKGRDEIVGLDVSIAKEIAKDMGVSLEIKNMRFDGLLAALDLENVDFVMAGVSPTYERGKNVDFSDIYFSSTQKIAIRSKDAKIIHSLSDLSGKKIGVQKGSIQANIAKMLLTKSEIKEIGKLPDLLLELSNKKVDAIVVEDIVIESYKRQDPNIYVLPMNLKNKNAGSAVAVKKGEKELLDSINKTIARLKNSGLIDEFCIEAVTSANSPGTTINPQVDAYKEYLTSDCSFGRLNLTVL